MWAHLVLDGMHMCTKVHNDMHMHMHRHIHMRMHMHMQASNMQRSHVYTYMHTVIAHAAYTVLL